MTQTIKSPADEMWAMSTEVEAIREEVVSTPTSDLKNRLLTALDMWRQDVTARGIPNIGFFETIPFYDRLVAIRGTLIMLRTQLTLPEAQ